MNYALDAVDKFGGRKARDRVDSVMTSELLLLSMILVSLMTLLAGSKLLGRFTK